MNNVDYDSLKYLNLLWLVAAAAAIAVRALWQRRRGLRKFADGPLQARLATRVSLARGISRIGLCVLALVLLTAAIIGPRWGEREEKMVTRGIDVMILLDVSRSMLARDVAPNRLERAKVAISADLLPKLGGDRVGLIAFAGVASLKCPLTNDYGFFRLALDEVGPNNIAQGGTLIGDAVRRAGECFDEGPNTHKILLLITDGEDHDSFPVEAARKLWDERKIPIVSVALGDERQGARVPMAEGTERYMQFHGEQVQSKARFDQLRDIAAISDLHGFVPAGTQDFDLGQIFAERIAPAIATREQSESQTVQRPSQYHPFALGALVLLLIDSLLREGSRRAAARGRQGEPRSAERSAA